jgi:hypothetical protein
MILGVQVIIDNLHWRSVVETNLHVVETWLDPRFEQFIFHDQIV